MKALVLVENEKLEVMEMPNPEIASPDEILVEVCACTICHTDLEIYRGTRKWGGGPPNMFGHEVTGIVHQIGKDVHNVQIGDRVLLRITSTGFAEYCKAKGVEAIRLPEEIGFEEGAIAQLMPIAVRGIEKSIKSGDTVFVSGQGPAGVLCNQVAKAYGAQKVIAADLYDQRLARGRDLGCDVAINAQRENVAERVKEETDGRGANVTVECVGIEPSFRNCEKACKNGGTIVVFGSHLKPIEIDLLSWEGRSLSLVIAREQPHETPYLLRRSIELISSGKVRLKPMLTHVFPLDRAPEAFEFLAHHPQQALKIAIVPM
ncbi:MAG: zinc-binding dehydrogenase, partial [Thermodesulfobacteriota bacterium]